MQNRKLGFQKDQVLILHDAYALRPNVLTFKNEVLKMSSIDHVTISGFVPVENESSSRNSSAL